MVVGRREAARASRRCSRCGPRPSSGARKSRSQIAWFERPSAISARTSRSRSVRSSSGTRARRRPTSWATTSGSITEPPRAIRRIGVGEVLEVVDAVLEEVAHPAGAIRDQAEREAWSRRTATGRGRRPPSRAPRGSPPPPAGPRRCAWAACGCRRSRRPGDARGPRPGARVASPAWATTSKPASASRRAMPSRSRTESSASAIRSVMAPGSAPGSAAPDSSSFGMNPRTRLASRRGP